MRLRFKHITRPCAVALVTALVSSGFGCFSCLRGGLDPIYGYVFDVGGPEEITRWALGSSDRAQVRDAQAALLELATSGSAGQRRAALDGYARIVRKQATGWVALEPPPPTSRSYARGELLRYSFERLARGVRACPKFAGELSEAYAGLRPPDDDREGRRIWSDVAEANGLKVRG
jgi:hypothetical protein